MVLRDQVVHTEHLELMPVFILILGKHRRILQKEKGFQYSYIIQKNPHLSSQTCVVEIVYFKNIKSIFITGVKVLNCFFICKYFVLKIVKWNLLINMFRIRINTINIL